MGLDSSRVLAVLGGGGSTPGSDFDRSGLVGLLPGKRGPRRPHKITPEVARFIEQTVVRGEELAAQRLVERIAERFGLVVHQRTVKRALARLKKKRSEPRCRQSRWSCVGGALRGFATRHGRLGRSPPYAAQFSACSCEKGWQRGSKTSGKSCRYAGISHRRLLQRCACPRALSRASSISSPPWHLQRHWRGAMSSEIWHH
jgi:hypothetical protein